MLIHLTPIIVNASRKSFYILLTVHHVMTLAKWPTWRTNSFLFYLFLFLTVYMFRAHRTHHQERKIVSIQPMVTVTLCWWPCLMHTTQPPTEWQLPEVVLTHFVPPDDEHDVLEICRELKIEINAQKGICASRCSFTKKRIERFCEEKHPIPNLITIRQFD